MGKSFTGFKDQGLYSKKQWLFSDKLVGNVGFIAIFVWVLLLLDIFETILNCKNIQFVTLKIVAAFAISYFIADVLTAITHCYFIDNSYSKKTYDVSEDGYLIIDTHVGYASCHHIFPSNWKDITDTTLLITMTILMLVPILITCFCVKNPVFKIFLYFLILQLFFSLFTHKYAHEKLHKRYVPAFIDFLLEKGIYLSPKKHQTHHIQNNYNWSLLNGSGDTFVDTAVRWLCSSYNKCPVEERQYNTMKYMKDQNKNIVKIRFVGDIEGTFQCRLEKNLFVEI
jgi:hypothetical protein